MSTSAGSLPGEPVFLKVPSLLNRCAMTWQAVTEEHESQWQKEAVQPSSSNLDVVHLAELARKLFAALEGEPSFDECSKATAWTASLHKIPPVPVETSLSPSVLPVVPAHSRTCPALVPGLSVV
eukprot:GHUV01036880.1.p2 GENE.GHUV01036880.1~~GHUV01036880.1.p2  ORF type:complete len:124 (+),score=24.90 GHUV01036880.1:444-815(+)